MKKFFLFALILFVFGCKKKEKDPAPDLGSEKRGIITFSVPGIPDENITIKDKQIIINLPKDFQGDIITPVVTMGGDFTLPEHIKNGFNFQGYNIDFALESPKYDPISYQVIVLSDDPIQISDAPKSYAITIEPATNMVVKIPVLFRGTGATLDKSGKLYYMPDVKVKNKADGSLLDNFWLDKSIDSTGRQFVTLYLSPMMDAGEYEATIQWGDKNVALSSPIVVKYGKMLIFNSVDAASKTDNQLNLGGYNIYPGNTYEALLENDFIGTRKISLTRKDYRNLAATLPNDLPTGGYYVTVVVNGKPVFNNNTGLTEYAGLQLKEIPNEPFIHLISQPSKKVTPSDMYSYYAGTSSISRNEQLLVDIRWPEKLENVSLRLVNRTTKQVFTLQTPGPSILVGEGAQIFSAYNIPAELPDGEYEAQTFSENAASPPSGRYPRILTIN